MDEIRNLKQENQYLYRKIERLEMQNKVLEDAIKALTKSPDALQKPLGANNHKKTLRLFTKRGE